jgi:hypothetical protein
MISVILIEQKMTLENLAKLVKEEEKSHSTPLQLRGLERPSTSSVCAIELLGSGLIDKSENEKKNP